ncbi:MAG: IS3 family transposase [Candidatus Obscuribacter sp.]|nr:IS3 family transposase [Candidatus Obscuribacter sp.]MBK9620133.1 IS3 family transposase [Candidatus Obscuribacter sp.]
MVEDGVAIKEACDAVALPRATYYRQTKITVVNKVPTAPKPVRRALTSEERQAVLRVLESPEYIDRAPREICASLADKGIYRCSVSTMYRIMGRSYEVKERRAVRRHQKYEMPVLRASGPNQVWAWDVTKLKGPHAWQFYFLYTIVDLYSRKVVGWMVAERENAKHAKRLFREVCRRERADSRQLIVHSDRGSTMTSLTLGLLFSSLGIVKSLSRPRVSNDNAFVESLFKTLKYRQLYPKRFYSLDEAQKYMREFFSWYNTEHYHSGVCHLTPHAVHSGLAASILKSRQAVMDTAYANHPERYVNGPPKVRELPTIVWLNGPQEKDEEKTA